MSVPQLSPGLHAHLGRLVRSHLKLTGRELFPGATSLPLPELARHLAEAPFVLVSHGTEADPVLNYGNPAALTLWEMDWETFTRTPSRLTAEAPDREERARLLARVSGHGFIDDYSGIRISRTGKRFRIEQAAVWNLLHDDGKPAGQAAAFSSWKHHSEHRTSNAEL